MQLISIEDVQKGSLEIAFARAVERKKVFPNIKYETTKRISETMRKYSKQEKCMVIRG